MLINLQDYRRAPPAHTHRRLTLAGLFWENVQEEEELVHPLEHSIDKRGRLRRVRRGRKKWVVDLGD